MSRHECDCGGIFADLELLARCQEHNHFRGEKGREPRPAEELMRATLSTIFDAVEDGSGELATDIRHLILQMNKALEAIQ